MNKSNSIEIISICLALDINASKLYLKLAESCHIEELKEFWLKMHGQEKKHVVFWENVLSMAKASMLPNVFDDPEQIKNELETNKIKSDALFKQFEISPYIPDTILLAYRMEFYLLHPAIETLFHYAKRFTDIENPEDSYTSHLNSFPDKFKKIGFISKEIEFLGEVIPTLWKRNQELVTYNSTDKLTGILNWGGFFNIVRPLSHLAKRNLKNVAMVISNIDNFKKINEIYGRQEGDEILTAVASILKSSIRRSDVVCRYGGEEFIIFLDAPNEDSVNEITEKLRQTVEKEVAPYLPVTISIGAAIGKIEDNVDDCIHSLIKSADACLYEAKNAGKNKVVIKMADA